MTSRHKLFIISTLSIIFFLNTNFIWAKSNNQINKFNNLRPKASIIKPNQTTISSNANIIRVVVKFKDQAQVQFKNKTLFSETGSSLSSVKTILRPYLNSSFKRLFNKFPETKLKHDKEIMQYKTGKELADLNSYYQINTNSPVEAEQLINQLNQLDIIEIAYAEPMPEPAGDIDPPTPDYSPFQDYRKAAPTGVDADYANTLPGGDGSGVKIIDIEGNWQTTHEDLDKALGGIIAGDPINDLSWRNHGTAVLGEMIAGDNGYGVTGICPGADIGMVSIGSMSTAQALYTAIDNLQAGDLILIELHAPGPHYNFETRTDQLGYVCMEYWQANFDAIQYAWAKGIVVIEAGGNGSEDFDDTNIYGQLFDTTYRNSHAIIVGAGYPASSSNDLQKHGFSNYGERVNLQGYGSGVYTCGYGGLFDGGGDENQFYTATFSGTSSASPIITGTAACLQGYYKATYGVTLTSDYIRNNLVAYGTLQLGDTSLHIGPRPNLQASISNLSTPPSLYTNPFYFDTTINDNDIATEDLWLFNRSNNDNIYFYIYDRDSLARGVVNSNWLQVSTQSGFIPPADSFLINVTLDGTAISQRAERYKGVVQILWGHSPSSLDSTANVPVYLTIPCNDSSYTTFSSDDIGGPTYNWISAKTLGTKIDNGSFYGSGTNPLDDGTSGPLYLGFSFPFYNNFYDSVYIGVNGGLSFTDTDINVGGYYSGLYIPGAPFTTFIAPFWDDLIIDPTVVPEAGIYYYTNPTNDTIVIEWYRLENFNSTDDTLTDFEVILSADGNVLCQYNNVGNSGLEQTALIGISEIECHANNYYNNGDNPAHVVANSEAVLFKYNYAYKMTGDLDNDGKVNASDVLILINYMFAGGTPPEPYNMGNVDCIDDVNANDVLYLINYMFSGGPAPCYTWMYTN